MASGAPGKAGKLLSDPVDRTETLALVRIAAIVSLSELAYGSLVCPIGLGGIRRHPDTHLPWCECRVPRDTGKSTSLPCRRTRLCRLLVTASRHLTNINCVPRSSVDSDRFSRQPILSARRRDTARYPGIQFRIVLHSIAGFQPRVVDFELMPARKWDPGKYEETRWPRVGRIKKADDCGQFTVAQTRSESPSRSVSAIAKPSAYQERDTCLGVEQKPGPRSFGYGELPGNLFGDSQEDLPVKPPSLRDSYRCRVKTAW